MKPEPLNKWNCQDCGKDTFKEDKDYYIVREEVWKQKGLNDSELLCMDCMESRIRRPLQVEDLTLCNLNTMMNPYTRQILLDWGIIEDKPFLSVFFRVYEEVYRKEQNQVTNE